MPLNLESNGSMRKNGTIYYQKAFNKTQRNKGPEGPVWLQVSPPERPHEAEVLVAVPLGRPFVLDGNVSPIRKRGELLRMVEHIGYHDLPVLPGCLGVAEHLVHIVLVHGHRVAAWYPLVEVALCHGPALGFHPGGELDLSLGAG